MPRSQPFTPSPVKLCDAKKTKTVIHLKHVEQHQKQLEEQMAKLLNAPNTPSQSNVCTDVACNEEQDKQTDLDASKCWAFPLDH